MNDGGGESGRDNQNNTAKSSSFSKPSGGADGFGRAVAKIAVAQVCESTGFQGSRHSALDALADVLVRYIRDLGKAAHFYANLSGRTDCNVFDIIQGLEDLESSRGFQGSSDIHRCAISSGVVTEITQFVGTSADNPFARVVPSFPIARQPKLTSSFAQAGKTPAERHIPDWLPVFPDPHAYIRTPVWKERSRDPKADKIKQARQRRKAEWSLLSLQQRLSCNGAFLPVLAADHNVEKGKQVVGDNPFLIPPLPCGEKQVSEVVVPEKAADEKRLSVLDTFAPAIEAAKHGYFDPGVSRNTLLPSKRPMVHFKFGVGKNSVVAQVGSSARAGKTDSWFLRDDEKDDKKRRAEMILKEAMEKPDGLPHL